MIKFIHAADIHLDSPMTGLERYEGAPVEQMRSATRRAFDNLIKLAIEQEVDFVLLAGDIFDGDWKDYNTGLYFNKCMAQLKDEGIRVFVIAGNHDADSQLSKKLPSLSNVKYFSTNKPEKIVIEELQVAIYGQGFANRAVTENIASNYPQGESHLFNIGMLHTCLDGKPGHKQYAPCAVDDLRSKGYQYWALGHVHKREVISESPWVIFSGNTQGRHIRETGAKGCTLVSIENNQIQAVKHQDLDVLRWCRCEVDVSGCETTDAIYQKVRNTLQDAIDTSENRPVAARLILTGSSPVHSELHAQKERWVQEYRSLANEFGGNGIWLEKVEIETQTHTSIQDLLAGDDALSGLLRSIKNIELDDNEIAEYSGEFSALLKKLPHELTTGDTNYNPTDPKIIKMALEDVKEILLTRLLSGAKAAREEAQ